MAEIKTKYSIGDTVYSDQIRPVVKQLPCPDCLDTNKWKATSPAGVDYEFDCPRCSVSYQSGREHSLLYTEYLPNAVQMTIGSVRYDSEDDEQVQYMCCETGVGSGRVYRQAELHATQEEALRVSEIKATFKNEDKEDFVLPLYESRVELRDYQLNCIPKSIAKKYK